jgi:hypothetical protein
MLRSHRPVRTPQHHRPTQLAGTLPEGTAFLTNCQK